MDNNAASQKYLIIIKVQLKVGSSCWISESKLLSYFVMNSMGTTFYIDELLYGPSQKKKYWIEPKS